MSARNEAEIGCTNKNKVLDMVDLPPGKSTIRCKWEFRTCSDGSIECYKACLIAKGFM